jgi:hypothetical protein
VTTSRRHQFAVAVLGLALAAFAAVPAMAATSTPVQHKTSHHATHASHKSKSRHSSSANKVAHHTSHHSTHKVTAS